MKNSLRFVFLVLGLVCCSAIVSSAYAQTAPAEIPTPPNVQGLLDSVTGNQTEVVKLDGLPNQSSQSSDAKINRLQADSAKQLERAKRRLTSHMLRYKYQPGETIRYRVEHLATVDTTMQGSNQKTKSRSHSTKAWKVESVDAAGMIKFQHQIDDVDMWSSMDGQKPIQYNSRQDENPPAEYDQVAASIGKPLSVITMNAHGRIVKREDQLKQANLGMGGLAVPLPEKEIPIGYTWATPYDVQVRLRDTRVKTIKTRQLYKLEKVETGVATISINTQVLTPVNDPQVRSQLVQRLSMGEIKFDIDAGRVLSKQLDWDENVIGFNGADSNMKYLARFTEELIVGATARKSLRTGESAK